MAEVKMREELEAGWWETWRTEDYSWAGLVTKNISGDGGLNGEQNLQDYWRADPETGEPRSDDGLLAAGQLVNHLGTFWHIAHVPLAWADGTPAKANWPDAQLALLAAVISKRVAAAQATEVTQQTFGKDIIDGADGRAQLQGSVLLASPAHPSGANHPIHIDATRCWLPHWRANKCHFGPGACFNGATFSDDASFISAVFSGDASFDSATFSGDARFEGAVLSREARFYSATFVHDVSFARTKFLDFTNFSGATFSGEAGFESATFSEYIGFDSATFSSNANFNSASYTRDAHFYNVVFSGEALFGGATFSGDANFNSAAFSSAASFEEATFSRAVSFDNSTFSGDAVFSGATFSGHAGFYSASFSNHATFNRATFLGCATFDSATFSKSVWFRKARFEQAELGLPAKSDRMSFEQCVFSGRADFFGACFAANPAHHSAAFLGARFADLANFRGCGDHWVAALDEVEIKGRLLIDDRDEKDALHTFDTIVLPQARAGGTNAATNESLLKELEGGCRAIKVAMGAARDEIMEQRYYRFQLLARREQSGIPRSEKIVSHLFGLTADYGMSLTRPLAGFVILLAVFTGVYALFWAATGGLAWNDALKSLEMAASRMFPFGAFESVSTEWFKALEARATTGTVIFARGLATVQSLASVLLVFMFGLAIRRRFKVS